MTPKADRQSLATGLRTALPAGWSVYASPAEVVSVPCVVTTPGSPYRELVTYTEEAMRLRLVVLLNRATGAEALDAVDDAIDDVLTALDAVTPSITWLGVDVQGVVEVNGAEYLSASIDLVVH